MRSDELIYKVLDAPGGGVEGLLQLSDHEENDWLEFKASIFPVGAGQAARESRADLAWNVARGVIALANTIGGALLIGVDDNADPVGLSASDPNNLFEKEGPEAFLRKVIDPIIRPEHGWNTRKHGVLKLSRDLPDSCVELKIRPYKTVKVVIVVVRPLALSEGLIGAVSTDQRKQFFPVRVLGDIGRVRDLYILDDVLRFRRDDLLSTDKFQVLWNQFTELQEEFDPGGLPADSEEHICKYNDLIKTKLAFLGDIFTPLSSEESLIVVPASMPEPQATEEHVEYDTWDVDKIAEDYEHQREEQLPAEYEETQNKESQFGGRAGPVLELMDHVPRSLWLGAPGSGKSTCLMRHCLNLVSMYQSGGVVGVYAPLRAYGCQRRREFRLNWPVWNSSQERGRYRVRELRD